MAVKASVKTRMAMALGTSVLMATMNVLLAVPVSLESAQAYVRATAGTNASNVVLYSAAEAAKVIDTVFKPNRRDALDYPDWKFEWMKRLVADGLAVMVGYDDVVHERSDWQKTFATHVYCLIRRFYDRERNTIWRNGEQFVYYSPRSDYRYDEVEFRKATGEKVYGLWEMNEAPEKVAILFGADRKVGLDNRVGTNVEASVIADVETVTLSSVSGLEKVIAAGGTDGDANGRGVFPIGHYRVSLLVRTALAGVTSANRLVFTAKTGAANATVGGHWLFYRGMTLKVGLRKTKDDFSICRIEPVLPYPPYTTDNVVVCEKEIPAASRFSLIGRWFDAVERGGVSILYGDHTRAEYFSHRNLIEGSCGTLPDFGAQSWVCAWTHGKGANLEYWRNAWFADVQSFRVFAEDPDSVVSLFQSAVAALSDQNADRLRFNWWNRVFPTVSFKSSATMKDVADFFTLATRPCSCADDVAYHVIADPDVAARLVRPLTASDVGAWETLQRVACENGCTIKVDGTNVTLSAELTDAEVTAPRVDELAATLEKEGFGSAAGAHYANVSFWARGIEYGSSDSSAEDDVITAVDPYVMNDDEGGLAGNGWLRTTADGTEQVLAYDAVWWDGAKGWRPNGEKEDVVCLRSKLVRVRRDILRSLDALNLLAEGAFGWELGDRQMKIDMHYLAFAFHVAQAGFKSEGQQLIDALWRRPVAAKKALVKLHERIGRPEAKCRTSREWYLLMRDKAEKQAKAKDEDKDKEDKDECDAD